MAANQARDLTEDKEIIVIPSKTVPQGDVYKRQCQYHPALWSRYSRLQAPLPSFGLTGTAAPDA